MHFVYDEDLDKFIEFDNEDDLIYYYICKYYDTTFNSHIFSELLINKRKREEKKYKRNIKIKI